MSSTSPLVYARPKRVRRWLALLLTGVALSTTQASTSALAAPAAHSWHNFAPTSLPGWQADFVDNFVGPLNTEVWGRYGGGAPVGAHSVYLRENVVTDQTVEAGDGVLTLTSKQTNGVWSSGGVSSGRGFAAAQGKWTIKAKFDRAYGVGYAFLLYPKGGGWPPEVDIIEGTMGGKEIMSTFHYGTAAQNFQEQRWLKNVDMTVWHTYGVVISGDVITYTLDGRPFASVTNAAAPRMPMWFGLQAGVKDCAKSTGECLSAATPLSSVITVDWVAHYRQV